MDTYQGIINQCAFPGCSSSPLPQTGSGGGSGGSGGSGLSSFKMYKVGIFELECGKCKKIEKGKSEMKTKSKRKLSRKKVKTNFKR